MKTNQTSNFIKKLLLATVLLTGILVLAPNKSKAQLYAQLEYTYDPTRLVVVENVSMHWYWDISFYTYYDSAATLMAGNETGNASLSVLEKTWVGTWPNQDNDSFPVSNSILTASEYHEFTGYDDITWYELDPNSTEYYLSDYPHVNNPGNNAYFSHFTF